MIYVGHSDNKNILGAFSPKIVGSCMQLAKLCYNKKNNIDENIFFEFYKNETKYGIKSLNKARNIILNEGYTYKETTEYVYKRVIKDTVKGLQKEIDVINDLYKKGYKAYFASADIDINYSVDLICKNFSIQVKPNTYKLGNNPSLNLDKQKHLMQHIAYQKKYNKPVFFIYYNKNTGVLDYENFKI